MIVSNGLTRYDVLDDKVLCAVGAVQTNYEEIARLIEEKDWDNARTVVMKAKYLEGISDAIKDRRHSLSP